ncbi:MAG: hypothetical protein ABIV43_04055 [Candidatus Saccharimonadales bacterium]
MAFGKKARIQQLELEAAVRDQELTEIGPYIDIAKEIQAGVGKIALETGNFDQAFSQTIADVSRERRMVAVQQIAQTLPPETLLTVLGKAYGDEEIKHALADIRQQELNKLNVRLTIDQLISKFKSTGIINLRDVELGSPVDIYFCEPMDPQFLRKHSPASTMSRQISGRMEPGGVVRVLEDTINSEWLSDIDQLSDHEAVTIGTRNLGSKPTSPLNPEMYVDALVTVQNVRLKVCDPIALDLMQVTVNGQDLVER